MLIYVKILKLSDHLDILHAEACMPTPHKLYFSNQTKNCAF